MTAPRITPERETELFNLIVSGMKPFADHFEYLRHTLPPAIFEDKDTPVYGDQKISGDEPNYCHSLCTTDFEIAANLYPILVLWLSGSSTNNACLRAELAEKDAEIARLKADQSSYRAGCSCGRSTWQPIETAPKDGTVVDLWHPGGARFTNCQWRDELGDFLHPDHGAGWWSVIDDDGFSLRIDNNSKPTHWTPIVAPPGAAPTPCACYRAGLERAAEIADGVADYYETAAAVGKWDSNKATKARSERDAAKRVAYVIRSERNTRPIVEDAGEEKRS